MVKQLKKKKSSEEDEINPEEWVHEVCPLLKARCKHIYCAFSNEKGFCPVPKLIPYMASLLNLLVEEMPAEELEDRATPAERPLGDYYE